MSTPTTPGAMPIRDAQATPRKSQGRDLRLDFFRGLALLMIFIDHVAGNQVAAVTLKSVGFADAAEVFVLIAGMAGVYAYRSTFLNKGLAAGAALVLARIRTLYLAHLLMIGGALLFAMAALLSDTGFDVIGKLGLEPLMQDPLHAFLRLPLLAYMPHYLDILPLYIVLFAMLPAIILGMRWHPLAPAAVMLGLYSLTHGAGLTLPNLGQPGGWFLNPFAWALLFSLGAASAELTLRGAWARLPRHVVAGVTAAAAAYVVFAFLHAAPWKVAPGLDSYAALGLTLEADKSLLSWHRLLDILAKAWLVAVLVPRQAAFMASGLGEAISRAGRHSLPVFAAGVMLSLAGSVALHESGGAIEWHLIISAVGVGMLLALAKLLDLRQGIPVRKTTLAAPARLPPAEGVSAS